MSKTGIKHLCLVFSCYFSFDGILILRWGGTPLQDAVCTGHREVATALRLSGGIMSDSFGSTRMFDAAARGDVKNLSLLIKHAGLKVI
jgi:hypothetical protein